jgi:hypothetical protein
MVEAGFKLGRGVNKFQYTNLLLGWAQKLENIIKNSAKIKTHNAKL